MRFAALTLAMSLLCFSIGAYGETSFPISAIADVTIQGASEQDNIGYEHLDGHGDFNGDGIGDFLLGTDYSVRRDVGIDVNYGYVLMGSREIPSLIDLADPPEDTVIISYDHMGFIDVAAGDFNGDGFCDAAFSLCDLDEYGVINGGAAAILYGGPNVPKRHSFESFTGAGCLILGYRRNNGLGFELGRAGDVNGDGFEDLLIGAPGRYQANDEQEAFLIYGGPDLPSRLWANQLGEHGVRFGGKNFGWSVGGAGDVNGDGLDDILIGAYGGVDDILGHSYLIYGATDLPSEITMADIESYGVDFVAEEIDDAFGGTVAGAGDINHDGYDDILLSAFYANPNRVDEAGKAYVVFGGPDLPSKMEIRDLGNRGITIYGTKIIEDVGKVLAALRDVQFDGFDDFTCTSGGMNRVPFFWGKSEMERGGPYTVDDLRDLEIHGEYPLQTLGSGAALIGDVNGDGWKDFMLGNMVAAPHGNFAAGEAYIIYGGTDTFDTPTPTPTYTPTATPTRPPNLLLSLDFDGTLTGADGETPLDATGTQFLPSVEKSGLRVDATGTLQYSVPGNIDPDSGMIEFRVQRLWDDGPQNEDFFVCGRKSENGIYIARDGAGNLRALTWSDGQEFGPGLKISDWEMGSWHHIQVLWGTEGVLLFVDGRFIRKDPFGDGYKAPERFDTSIYIGNSIYAGGANAVIDSLRVWGFDRPTATATPTESNTPLPNVDFNGDGVIDEKDLLEIMRSWHEQQ